MALLVIELGGILEEGREIGCAALLGDFRQIGGVIGALAEQGVAIDAVVLVPDILAARDLRGDLVGIGQFGELSVTVDCQAKKYNNSDSGRYQSERACLSFIHCQLSRRRCRSNR
ncbi:hypothetical protein D3C86_1588570 [compost metagenome]